MELPIKLAELITLVMFVMPGSDLLLTIVKRAGWELKGWGAVSVVGLVSLAFTAIGVSLGWVSCEWQPEHIVECVSVVTGTAAAAYALIWGSLKKRVITRAT